MAPKTPHTPDWAPVDEMRDLFAPPAGWMLYWGNAVLLGLVILLLALAAWVRYPDEVETQVQLTRHPAPLRLVAPAAARVDTLLVGEGAEVVAETPLILLDNPAELPAVDQLAALLNRLRTLEEPASLAWGSWPPELAVGELRPAYAQLQNTAAELHYWLERTASGRQRQSLVRQSRSIDTLYTHLRRQLDRMAGEVAIARDNAENFASLFERDAASQIERDEARIRYLRLLREEEQLRSEERRLALERARLDRELTVLREDQSDEVTGLWLRLQAEVRSLQQALAVWEDRYLVRAPKPGRVSFPRPVQAGQFVADQELLCTLQPGAGEATLLAEGRIGAEALGKIGVGSPALLRLAAYPFREYGQVPAEVRAISPTAAQRDAAVAYRLQLSLPQGLQSTYGDTLAFRQDMPATAVIIAEERSLLGRLFDRLRQVVE